MPSARPPVLIKAYTVECAWPCAPNRYRETVSEVPERVAQGSARALLSMNYAFRVKVAFFLATPGRPMIGEIVAAQWDRHGNMTHRHGEHVSIKINPRHQRVVEKMPEWLTNDYCLQEVSSEPVASGS